MNRFARLAKFKQRRKQDGKAFTLLELIVVLLVLGVLAAIAVPTYNTLKTNSVDRSVNTTLDAIARAGEAAYISDPAWFGDAAQGDARTAAASIEGLDADDDADTPGYQQGDRTITLDGAGGVEVELSSGTITRSGTVSFASGVSSVAYAGAAPGGGGPATTAPPPATVPGAPLITSLTPGNTALSVSFAAPVSDGGSVVTDYEYSIDDGMTWVSASTTSSPFSISGLVNGTVYQVLLRAVNAVGAGAPDGDIGTPNPSWSLLGADLDGGAGSDRSGESISLSSNGTVLAVGAPFDDGAGFNAGHVRVYAWNGTSWVQRGADIDGEAAGDQFGGSTALSGDGSVLVVGGAYNDGNGSSAGHVRVYAWNGTSWVQRGGDFDGAASNDYFGAKVAVSADGLVFAAAAPYNDDGGSNAGRVDVFVWNGASWSQRGSGIAGEAAGDESGSAVSLSSDGSVLMIGARANSSWRGHVRVYAWNGTSWAQRGADVNGEALDDEFGYAGSLSSDGTVFAAGAYGNDGGGSSAGHVRVYAWNGAGWVQRGGDIDGEAAGGYFGHSVALSGDGTVVSAGAPYNDDSGADAGHVRVYTWNGTSWAQRGADIDGEAAGDQSGYSVALSSDGSVVVSGAPQNDGSAGNAGHVRVYSWS